VQAVVVVEVQQVAHLVVQVAAALARLQGLVWMVQLTLVAVAVRQEQTHRVMAAQVLSLFDT
jgi:hypothetical protein